LEIPIVEAPVSREEALAWARAKYPTHTSRDLEPLVSEVVKMGMRKPKVDWTSVYSHTKWGALLAATPYANEPESVAYKAVEIAKYGIDTPISDRPRSYQPVEQKMKPDDLAKLLAQLQVQLDKSFSMGPIRKPAGTLAPVHILAPNGDLFRLTFSPIFGIGKTDGSVRILFDQGKYVKDKFGEYMTPLNDLLLDKHALMHGATWWARCLLGCHWFACDDISKGFFRSWMSHRRACFSGAWAAMFLFVMIVGQMGAADTPIQGADDRPHTPRYLLQ